MSVTTEIRQKFEAETGIRVKPEWVQTCLASRPVDQPEIQHLFACFLESDLTAIGTGSLPADLKGMQRGKLRGQFVVQAEEVVNIAAPIKHRYKPAGKGRCLKLQLSDGVQRIQAIEMKLISTLDPFMPAGVKIAIKDVEVRRGLLLLYQENVCVLGGQVAFMEAARKRMMQKWGEPADGNQQNILAAMTQASWRAAETDMNQNAPRDIPGTADAPRQHFVANAQQQQGSSVLASPANDPNRISPNANDQNTHASVNRVGQAVLAPQRRATSHNVAIRPELSLTGLSHGSHNVVSEDQPSVRRNWPESETNARQTNPALLHYDSALNVQQGTPHITQSQSLGGPAVQGFSRGLTRNTTGLQPQRPPNSGQHNLTQSKRHIPERQNQEPGPSRHNNTWPEHVQEGHENQRPGGVQQATLGQPASHESDAERIWPGIDKLMMEHDVDMVPDTIMQDDFEMQEQLSNGPSPEKDGGNVLQEEEPTRSRTPAGLSEPNSKQTSPPEFKRARLDPVAEEDLVDLVSPCDRISDPGTSRNDRNMKGSGQAESDSYDGGSHQMSQGNVVDSSDEDGASLQATSKAEAKGKRAFCLESSPDISEGGSRSSAVHESWHTPLQQSGNSQPSPCFNEESPPVQRSDGSNAMEDQVSSRGTQKLVDTSNTRAEAEDQVESMTLRQCQERIQDTDPQDLPIHLLAPAKISKGSKLSIRPGDSGLQYYMEVNLEDGQTALQAVLSHHLIQSYVDCDPMDAQQAGRAAFYPLTEYISGFQGYVALCQEPGHEFPLVTNLNKDSSAFS